MLLLSHYVSSEEYILHYDDISILENIDNLVYHFDTLVQFESYYP